MIRPESPAEFHPSVRVIRADVTSPGTITGALPGQDAVLSCLGIRRRHPANPWSTITSPFDLTSRATRQLVAAMQRQGVARAAAISAGGVGDSAPLIPALLRGMIARSKVGVAYRDLEVMESVLRGSGLDWMAVRPVTLINGPPTGRAALMPRYRLWSRISRADVAGWMLAAVEEPSPFPHRTPLIGWGGDDPAPEPEEDR
jgi:uncharacterized protein YbjT (DUF2867 family)